MLIENWRQAWKMLSVQVQLLWGTSCGVFVALPQDQQGAMLSLLGLEAGGVAAATFVAKVAAAFAAVTVAARVTAQPRLQQ
jgi:hypothetical protein